MIDLHHTKEQMLAEIKASAAAFANCANDPGDPRLVSPDGARLILEGKTPQDLLPALDAAFSKRFAEVPREQLHRDLTYPVKKGLGNAYKWGNQKDPAKRIAVETVVTHAGALVAISDQGKGFNVQDVLGRFHDHKQYFTHGGSGFTFFSKTKSLVSYADGGRTLLIRFLCAPESAKAAVSADGSTLGIAGDEEFMKDFLAAELPYFRKYKATLDSCRISVPDKQKEDQAEIKYVLEYRKRKSEKTKNMTLTGRLLPESAAQIDFSAAAQLYKAQPKGKKAVNIPKPMAVFQQPSLALFRFNPSKDLREHLKKISAFKDVAKVVKMVALGLRAMHRSVIALAVEETLEDALERHRAAAKRIVTKLAQAGPQRVERVQHFFNHLVARAAALKSCEPAPIHGALGWNCILCEGKRFYFYKFDNCRRSHPGYDAGGFLADLLRFYVLGKKRDEDFYRLGREIFLKTYFGDAPPSWQADLPFFIAAALLLRLDHLLQRPDEKWEPKLDALLEQCEGALQ
jgi:anti-sigma regulatory factor (Ser/Thr protein kinase)